MHPPLCLPSSPTPNIFHSESHLKHISNNPSQNSHLLANCAEYLRTLLLLSCWEGGMLPQHWALWGKGCSEPYRPWDQPYEEGCGMGAHRGSQDGELLLWGSDAACWRCSVMGLRWKGLTLCLMEHPKIPPQGRFGSIIVKYVENTSAGVSSLSLHPHGREYASACVPCATASSIHPSC